MADPIADNMHDFIDRWREVAITELAHQQRKVAGHPVAWWFDLTNASTADFMKGLASDKALVTPGDANASPFLTNFLKPTRPMGNRLAADRPLVEAWIAGGCPLPENAVFQVIRGGTAKAAARLIPYTAATTDEELLANEPAYFHQLINIEDYPEFLPDARLLATHYLTIGASASVKDSPYEPLEDFHVYDEDEFAARMKKIYDTFLLTMYDTHWFDTGILEFPDEAGTKRKFNIGQLSDAVVRERMLQLAPFNLVDGAWLQSAVTVGPIEKVQSNLFGIWNDEAGNGVPSQNHANVYDALLKSQNIYLPPITTREFIELDFLPGAFTASVFQLAIGRFPETFFPELLGMTLYLEWEATPTLTAAVRMYRRRRINPLFYQLHVAIDNISEGHGAAAFEAVRLYLEAKREEGGNAAVQEQWARIRSGYITWATMGGLGNELIERFLSIERKQINISADTTKHVCWPEPKAFAERQMLKLVAHKAAIAREVHQGRSIGGRSLADLFDDPPALLRALIDNHYVDPERPRDSKFIRLMDFNGPMYKVFTDHDKTIILDWIESLRSRATPCVDPMPETPAPTDLATQFRDIIASKAGDAATAHDGIMMRAEDGSETELKALFEHPETVMLALVSNGWIVPGDPARSIFLARILNNGGPMDGVFNDAEREVVRAWIVDGARMPSTASALIAEADEGALRELVDVQEAVARPLLGRHLIGMGTVH